MLMLRATGLGEGGREAENVLHLEYNGLPASVAESLGEEQNTWETGRSRIFSPGLMEGPL